MVKLNCLRISICERNKMDEELEYSGYSIGEFWRRTEEKSLTVLFIIGFIISIVLLIITLPADLHTIFFGSVICLFLIIAVGIAYDDYSKYKIDIEFDELIASEDIEKLSKMAKEGSHRERAIEILGTIQAKDVLISIMKDDEDIDYRLLALDSLLMIGGEEVTEVIKDEIDNQANVDYKFNFAIAHVELVGSKSIGTKIIDEMYDELPEDEQKKYDSLCRRLVFEDKIENIKSSADKDEEKSREILISSTAHYSQVTTLSKETIEQMKSLQSTIEIQQNNIDELKSVIESLEDELDNYKTNPYKLTQAEMTRTLNDISKEKDPEKRAHLAITLKTLSESIFEKKKEGFMKKIGLFIAPFLSIVEAIVIAVMAMA